MTEREGVNAFTPVDVLVVEVEGREGDDILNEIHKNQYFGPTCDYVAIPFQTARQLPGETVLCDVCFPEVEFND